MDKVPHDHAYAGSVDIDGGCRVMKDDRPLSPARSQKVRNHSPDGFAWGYCGSGPAQLALAILLEETAGDEAQAAYQDFKAQVVADWPIDGGWALTSRAVHEWLARWRS